VRRLKRRFSSQTPADRGQRQRPRNGFTWSPHWSWRLAHNALCLAHAGDSLNGDETTIRSERIVSARRSQLLLLIRLHAPSRTAESTARTDGMEQARDLPVVSVRAHCRPQTTAMILAANSDAFCTAIVGKLENATYNRVTILRQACGCIRLTGSAHESVGVEFHFEIDRQPISLRRHSGDL
jgi:hypothetical protein